MANSYLTRTPSSTGNRRKFTFSAWIKFNFNQLANNSRIFGCGSATSAWVSAYINADATLQLAIVEGGNTYTIQTNRLFRDENAWYHLVFVVDTENATADNRLRIYVNGQEETSFAQRVNPTQNLDTQANTASKPIDIGSAENIGYTPRYFPGYMSHVAMVDGTVLTPTSFGETDSTSGIWKFKSPSGLSWGTNGFHLKFENSGALGTDSSGQGNTFTVQGNLKQALDTPSNNHATINPLYKNSATYANGNLKSTNASNKFGGVATIGVSTGKWYAEFKYGSNSNQYGAVGIYGDPEAASNGNQGVGKQSNSYSYRSDAYKLIENTDTSYGNSYGSGDIVGIALDLDNNKLYFSKNGTWQNSGDPTSGSTGTGAIPISLTSNTGFWFIAANSNSASNTAVWEHNYGNGYFGTTAITSAGSNGNGSLFEYDVPTGYYALNTKNLNTYG